MTAEGCTFLADEVENLKNSDREQFGAIIGIINAGFAKGATVRRMVQIEGEWVQKKFPVYGPKVLSGIANVSDTIRDRSLPIRMTRKSPKKKSLDSICAGKGKDWASWRHRWRFGRRKTAR